MPDLACDALGNALDPLRLLQVPNSMFLQHGSLKAACGRAWRPPVAQASRAQVLTSIFHRYVSDEDEEDFDDDGEGEDEEVEEEDAGGEDDEEAEKGMYPAARTVIPHPFISNR